MCDDLTLETFIQNINNIKNFSIITKDDKCFKLKDEDVQKMIDILKKSEIFIKGMDYYGKAKGFVGISGGNTSDMSSIINRIQQHGGMDMSLYNQIQNNNTDTLGSITEFH